VVPPWGDLLGYRSHSILFAVYPDPGVDSSDGGFDRRSGHKGERGLEAFGRVSAKGMKTAKSRRRITLPAVVVEALGAERAA
jgi:hypothetical protein